MGVTKQLTRSRRRYATLEPRVTNISQAVVKKWKTLPETSQFRLSQLLESVQRESLAGLDKKNRKKNEVADTGLDEQEVVKDFSEKLTSRIPRMQFPPRIDERDFDFEGTLQRVRMLENQLTSNIHSVGLLKAQIKKEEQMLEKDKQELKALLHGARQSKAMRMEQAKKLHPLARDLPDHDENDYADGYGTSTTTPILPLSLDLHDDREAQNLVEQLRSHLESIQNNTAGTRGVVEAMEHVQTKLDIFTARSLTSRQYERLHGVEMG